VRRAAARRLNYELGIPLEHTSPEKFQYLTRIHYCDLGDGQWGEHEIAYMLFLRGDFALDVNTDEVITCQLFICVHVRGERTHVEHQVFLFSC